MTGRRFARPGRTLLAVVAVWSVTVGCSIDNRADETATPTSSTSSSAVRGPTPTSPAAATTTVVGGIILADLGTTVTTDAGNTVVVKTVEFPLDEDHPDPDLVYAAIEVEVCAGDDVDDAGVRPAFFQLETGREAAWVSVDPVKEPALHDVDLAPGRCAGGWVTFSIARGLRPNLATMQTRSTKAAWRIP